MSLKQDGITSDSLERETLNLSLVYPLLPKGSQLSGCEERVQPQPQDGAQVHCQVLWPAPDFLITSDLATSQPPALRRCHALSARLRCCHLLWTNGLPLCDWGDWEESVGYLRRAPGLFQGFLFLHCNAKCSWINLLEEGQRGVVSFLLVGVDATSDTPPPDNKTTKHIWGIKWKHGEFGYQHPRKEIRRQLYCYFFFVLWLQN